MIYFGASNSYNGFITNFDKIFDREKLSRLYIIKGGPGTGKSTMMRTIAKHFSSLPKIEIRCSSDPDSLDGLLIESGAKTVGIVDGTSPHVVEADFPGAIEDIINLYDGFNNSNLSKRYIDLNRLSLLKRNLYVRAYEALNVAGQIHNYISTNYIDNSTYKKAEYILRKEINVEKKKFGQITSSNFMRTSFSKNGLQSIADPGNKKEVILIKGDGISEYIAMKVLCDFLKRERIAALIYSSPLSKGLIDTIETDDAIYAISYKDNVESVNVSEIIDRDGYRSMHYSYSNFIKEAQVCFAEAALLHAEIEKIYSSSIDFTVNDSKTKDAIDKISAIFAE